MRIQVSQCTKKQRPESGVFLFPLMMNPYLVIQLHFLRETEVLRLLSPGILPLSMWMEEKQCILMETVIS